MRRREFIMLVGGAAVAWPLAARAQPSDRVRRVAVLMGGLAEGDAGGQAEVAAFREALEGLGWKVGRNIQIDYRWPGAELKRVREGARDIVGMRPELVLSRTTPATAALMQEGTALPIVFVVVAEPVGSGFVHSLARPGGNMTGFTNFEASVGGKWVELLKEMSSSVTRIALLFNPQTAPFAEAFLRSAEAAGRTLGAAVISAPIGSDADIESTLAALAREPGGGLIGITDSFIAEHHDLIIALAARHRLPAVYANRIFVPSGGLMAYAVDYPDLFRRAAAYVDRILKDASPADLPVQQPAKFELSINLKTAKALDLTVPQSLLARADEVIE